MQVLVGLPQVTASDPSRFATAEALATMAAAIEDMGFDGVWVTDHPFPHPDWFADGAHHALDPFVALTAMAMASRRLRLATHLLVAAYRNPFLLAHAVASLDVLSNGRVAVGLGAGYLAPEFEALGASFDDRNADFDECLTALRAAWGGAPVHQHGRRFDARGTVLAPTPVQSPHPPLWIGGNSASAVRRAATRGDGWIPFPNPVRFATPRRTAAIASFDDLREKIATVDELRSAGGREGAFDISFSLEAGAKWAGPGSSMLDGAARLAALGVTIGTIALPVVDDMATLLGKLERAATHVADIHRIEPAT